ncbi:MAG TPA: NUDIX domain-containing protein [Candidatus Saccharimonadales bacterium]|nr:NUDIX domain-containing protein [Candidatus Saccharimonadales bacterium]
MRQAARAIIIKDDRLLVMHRNKFGEHYDTLPGGNIERGESPEQALAREISEETTLTFTNPKLVIIEHAGEPYGDQYIYLCDYRSGEPKLHQNSEENQLNQLGQNLHQPGWMWLDDLPNANFVSPNLKQTILNAHQNGWPIKPIELTTSRV